MSKDARRSRWALGLVALALLGASHRTPNFVVQASSPELAAEVGQTAEQLRHGLAQLWLGESLPNWSRPCPIRVDEGPQLGAGGATSFVFHHGEVFDWDMQIQGSRERILDSVLPHEVTHTIFASHFRQPLPRWADEGACTTVEHDSEKAKQDRMLIDFLQTGRGIPFSQMFAMKEYPADILPLYAQGYSLARFLIGQGGRARYISYVGEGLKSGHWVPVTRDFYGYPSLAALQDAWLDWVRQGSPELTPQTPPGSTAPPVQLAALERRPRPTPNLIYRGQRAGFLAEQLERLLPPWRPSRADQAGRHAAEAPTPVTPPLVDPRATPHAQPATAAALAAIPPGAVPRAAPPTVAIPSNVAPPRPSAGPRQVLVEWSRTSPAAETATAPRANYTRRPVSPAPRPRRAATSPTATSQATPSPAATFPTAPVRTIREPILFDAPPRRPTTVLR